MGQGGDLAASLEVDDALVAMGAVAVGDVAAQGVVGGVPVQVVGVLDDELRGAVSPACRTAHVHGRTVDRSAVMLVGDAC